MPNAAIDNIIKKTGKSRKEIEKYWKEAKKAASKKGFDDSNNDFWAYAMAILMKRTKITTETIHEIHSTLMNDTDMRIHLITEFTGDKEYTDGMWEACKKQSLVYQKTNNSTKQETLDYAISVLEAAVMYPKKKSEIFSKKPNTKKKRQDIDKRIKTALGKEGYSDLIDDGFDIKKVSDDELDGLETQVTKISKNKKVKNPLALLGTIAMGFVGGVGAAKTIDSFFSIFKD